ncbi:MAG: CoA-binding protein [Chloroflexi bacterium]|nr:CoA-binding protein [Chloroflexota bacterium]
MAANLKEKVADFLAQENIAVAGVSRNEKSPGAANAIYKRLRESGYHVYAINPNADQVEGDRCYHSVKDIPNKVGGIVIATPEAAAEQVVRDCVDAGVTRVWMHNGIHSMGTSVSQSAVDYAVEHKMSVIAGACPLMFGRPSDGFHRFMGRALGAFGKLPK